MAAFCIIELAKVSRTVLMSMYCDVDIQSLEEQSLEQLTIDSFGGACQVTFMCVPVPAYTEAI